MLLRYRKMRQKQRTAQGGMGRLTISGLHKFYGSTHAVRGVDLEIPEGAFAVLVGTSACGTSTLLRAIARFWGQVR